MNQQIELIRQQHISAIRELCRRNNISFAEMIELYERDSFMLGAVNALQSVMVECAVRHLLINEGTMVTV
jgi:hypothetical protein